MGKQSCHVLDILLKYLSIYSYMGCYTITLGWAKSKLRPIGKHLEDMTPCLEVPRRPAVFHFQNYNDKVPKAEIRNGCTYEHGYFWIWHHMLRISTRACLPNLLATPVYMELISF